MDPDSDREALIRELRSFRKGVGEPAANRMVSLFYLNEALGQGVPQRAFQELENLKNELGQDPMTAIGAFFFLSGWGVGLSSVDERRRQYVERHYAGDVSTPWRRSERGIVELISLIKDRDESHRPIAFIGIIPDRDGFKTALGFKYSPVGWAKPAVFINDDEYDLDEHVNIELDNRGSLGRQFVLPRVALDASVGATQNMSAVRVSWAVSVWPAWKVLSWFDDSRALIQTRTFAQQSIEVSIRSTAVLGWPTTPIAERAALISALDDRSWRIGDEQDCRH